MAPENIVPESVFQLLYLASIPSMRLVGCGSGTGGRRLLLPTVTAAILIDSTIALIAGLNRARRGLIKARQQSAVHLRESLGKSVP
jgi:hypothetical protein